MKLTLFLLIAVALESVNAGTYEPNKKFSCGLQKYLGQVREQKVTSVSELMDQYGGLSRLVNRYSPGTSPVIAMLGCRYLYSHKWGWLDMLHFTSAAYTANTIFYSSYGTLLRGERTEAEQFINGEASAWDYEDLVSNLIGVYFEIYLESGVASNKQFMTNLETYLSELGFGDHPELAPNFDSLPEGEGTDSGITNRSYVPLYIENSFEMTDLDLKLSDFLQRYLQSQGR